ncbi:MAG: hypothetical protein IKT68_03290 [Clostridia bacterium]|nr:hypothetical protein [Clostridia bacterium]
MKKDLIFSPILLAIGIVLALLRVTHMPIHIAASVLGVVVLVAYTVVTKKEWKLPAVEVIMRLFYGIALVTGGVLMKVHSVPVLSALHKISAVSFVLLLVFLFVHKLLAKRRGR